MAVGAKVHPALLALLALFAAVLIATPATADDLWAVRSGQAVFYFNQLLLHDLGLDLTVETDQPDDDLGTMIEEPHWTFGFRKGSDLRFRSQRGVVGPRGVMSGAIKLEGAITLIDRASGRSMRFEDLEIARGAFSGSTDPEEIGGTEPLVLRSGVSKVVFCDLVHSMFQFGAKERSVRVHYLNARISESWARSIGRPDLAGWIVGGGEIVAEASPISVVPGATVARRRPASPDATNKDVSLGALSSIQQVSHAGTWPTGGTGLSMSTTSCNLGDVDVPWLAPMEEDHPMIAMALYRQLAGRFEQIGVSWMKHGFYALSNSQCTPCLDGSDGSYLAIGCSDTYSVTNNSSRSYLGPREEVNPWKGTWTCLGSHFSGGQPDCVRRHDGGSPHGPLDHLLVAADADLANAGATYFYEAYYVVSGDKKLSNNWGSRRCTMSWNGSTWVFSTPSAGSGNALVEGPAIGRWGDFTDTVKVAVNDGEVMLAVTATDLGAGVYHYEYAMMNLNSDRQVRSFSIPVLGVSNLTNLGFHDSDGDASNDWAVTVESDRITWQAPTFAENPDAHALEFGYLFNFRFDADAAPSDLAATLGLFKGTDSTVTAATRGPTNAALAVLDRSVPQPRLLGVRPNPSSHGTTISFELARPGGVRLDIHDAAGRLVRHVVDDTRAAGIHSATWNGAFESGARAPAGVYHARLRAGGFTAVKSLVVVN